MCNSLSLKHDVKCPLRRCFQGEKIQNVAAGGVSGGPASAQSTAFMGVLGRKELCWGCSACPLCTSAGQGTLLSQGKASGVPAFIPDPAGIYPWENKSQGARSQGAAGGVSRLNAMVTRLVSSFSCGGGEREAKKAAAGWWGWGKEGSKSPSCSSHPQTQPGFSDVCRVQKEGESSEKYPGEPVAPNALFTSIHIKDTDQVLGFNSKLQ